VKGTTGVIRKISYHLVGHCDCCDGYRTLKYQDEELGFLCLRCADHSMVADIELNCGGYNLCRPNSPPGEQPQTERVAQT
jgi:hypothetical protein